MIVGFTGSRKGLTEKQDKEIYSFLLENIDDIELCVSGQCVGADEEFFEICEDLDLLQKLRPGYSSKNPDDLTNRANISCENVCPPEAYFARNRKIVEECDILLVAPSHSNKKAGGTWYTHNYALKINKPVKIFWC